MRKHSHTPLRPLPAAFAAFALLLGLCAAAHAINEEDRPPLLPAAPGCQRWLGSASGNDPSVRLQFRLCEQDGQVTGENQWSSLRSGWNLRELEGSWSSDRNLLILHDIRVAEERPEPGWRFCEVDTYTLRREGDKLIGGYDSAACSDHATVELTLQGDDSGLATPTLPPPSTPRPDVGNDVCGCHAANARPVSGGWAGLVLLLGAMVVVKRRRRPTPSPRTRPP